MLGSFQTRGATAAHDRLHARCLVLDDGETRVAFVICDNCLIPRTIYDEAKAIASKRTGIPMNQILTAATHTHTSPVAMQLGQSPRDPAYEKQLTKQIAEAIIVANKRLGPVELGWSVVAVPDEVSNRRWFVKPAAMGTNPFGRGDDRVRMNPPRGTGLLIRPAGPVDPDVTFLSVRTLDGKPVSVLANYGLHYVGGVEAGKLSADYFGEFARQIANRLDADETFVGIMSNGASGDVNNYQFLNPRPRAAPYKRIAAVASKIADRVHAEQSRIRFTADASLRMVEQEISLGVRKPNAADLKRARELFKSAANPERLTSEEMYGQESIRLHDAPPTVRIKLQTVSCGDLAIVAIPCEVFAEIGLEIKRRSPFKTTFVIGLANGYNGYLPTPKQHALGGYETWRSGWSYLEKEASTIITKKTLEMLDDIHRQ